MKFFWRAKRDDAQSAALKPRSDVSANDGDVGIKATQSQGKQSESTPSDGHTDGDGAAANENTVEARAESVAAAAASQNSKSDVVTSDDEATRVTVDEKKADTKSDTKSETSNPTTVSEGAESNVVALPPARLSERIAAAAMTTVAPRTPGEVVAKTSSVQLTAETLQPRAPGPLPGQEVAFEQLGRLLENPHAAGNILLLGPAGSGRRTALKTQLEQHRDALPRPDDWLYVVTAIDSPRIKLFALPHGQGALLSREAAVAISKAKANYDRLIASDEFRLGLEIIDEEFRHKSGKTLETLKRRAEDQNIALVKTPDGFVLAPMHDGKVVRNDVFRALPEQLQRDVEAKIAGLEGELKAFIDALPGDDTHQAERIAAFNRETAARAVKPHLEPVRLAFNSCGDFIDELQSSLVAARAASTRIAAGEDGRATESTGAIGVRVLNLQTASDFAQPAPVVMAHDVTPAGLLGELGRDASGQLALVPGHMAEANGGYLVVEAWRLVADPTAWCALSAAMAKRELKPILRGGLVADRDLLPFSGRIIVIADEVSFGKLMELDPDARRHFQHVVRFRASVPRSAVSVDDYASIAARVAMQSSLRPIATNAADALYRAAVAREEAGDRLTLDTHALANLLMEADFEAAAARSDHIRAKDVETATKRAAEARLS